MKTRWAPKTLLLLAFLQIGVRAFADPSTDRLAALNAYWKEVSQAVKTGDFAGYRATCHPKGVLVNGIRGTSYPLTKALAGWEQGFHDTKSGKQSASVEFRFSQRLGDETTAHETGMFLYIATDTEGNETRSYIHFEGLLIKEDRWLILMEYQKSRGTAEEWKALDSPQIKLTPSGTSK